MSFLEALYEKSPVPVQNAMVSTRGALTYAERFAPPYGRYLREAIERSAWGRQDLLAYQADQLVRFVRHAYDGSPYYRQLLDASGISPDSVVDPEALRRVPVLEKDVLRTRAGEIRSAASFGSVIPASTSGTTGTPIRVGYFADDMKRRYASLFRALADHGVHPRSRSVRFSGRTFFPGAEKSRKFWRYNVARRQLFMSSYFLTPDNLPRYVSKLVDFAPVLIDGYPSAMYVIARHLNREGLAGSIPARVFLTTGETLEDHHRDEIMRAFPGATVLNQYASAEGAPFITENRAGELVVNLDTGVFEFVRPGTEIPAQAGEVAEMLLTSFTTRAYPLIRYRIGDTVLVSGKDRSSTWDMPVVEAIYGRQEDIIYSRHRGFVGRLSPALKVAPPSIRLCQVTQLSEDEFTLKVVPAERFMISDVAGVLSELRARLGPVDISVEVVESLELGPNGKLRAVIGLASAGKARG